MKRTPMIGDRVVVFHDPQCEGVVIGIATDRDNEETYAKVQYKWLGFILRSRWVWSFDLKYLDSVKPRISTSEVTLQGDKR